MRRSIVAYRLDDEHHWVAMLDCGHPQHVRHNPPLVSRPWVLTEAGRTSRLGVMLNCVRCDRMEWPDGVERYKRTAVYDETSVPAGLRRNHQTGRGVWARIVVLDGGLWYRVPSLETEMWLTASEPGVVIPEVTHSVGVEGPVRFCIDFYKH